MITDLPERMVESGLDPYDACAVALDEVLDVEIDYREHDCLRFVNRIWRLHGVKVLSPYVRYRTKAGALKVIQTETTKSGAPDGSLLTLLDAGLTRIAWPQARRCDMAAEPRDGGIGLALGIVWDSQVVFLGGGGEHRTHPLDKDGLIFFRRP